MAISSYRGNDQITGTGDTCGVTSELFNNDRDNCSLRVIPRGKRSLCYLIEAMNNVYRQRKMGKEKKENGTRIN